MFYDEPTLVFHGTTREYVRQQLMRHSGLQRGEAITGSPLYFGIPRRGCNEINGKYDPNLPRRGAFIDTTPGWAVISAHKHAETFGTTAVILCSNSYDLGDKIQADTNYYPLVQYGWPQRTFIEIDISDVSVQRNCYDEEIVRERVRKAVISQTKFQIPNQTNWNMMFRKDWTRSAESDPFDDYTDPCDL